MIDISDNITGAVQPLSPLLAVLEAHFPGRIASIASAFPHWPMEAWSNSFVLRLFDDRRWFLKGTPRCRREAELMVAMHALGIGHVPAVIADDLMPEDLWWWFLLDDAGEPVHAESLDFSHPALACEAVITLAAVQRQTRDRQEIRQLVPSCRPVDLQAISREVCVRYGKQSADPKPFAEIATLIDETGAYFDDLAMRLAVLPDMLVHGDLWAGNVVRAHETMRLIDWGDAMWGPGGISIVHLLGQHTQSLTEHEEDIWAAYATALGEKIPRSYRQACREASVISDIIVHDQINRCCTPDQDVVNGYLKTFQLLARQIMAASPNL